MQFMDYAIFLSTLPARGATFEAEGRTASGQHFYPRSPRGERHSLPFRAYARI